MARGATKTSFKPGQSGNPNGRPKGAKNVVPMVRALVNAVMQDNEDAVREALRRAAVNPKTVLAVVELQARLNREIGPGSEGSVTPIVFIGGDKTVEAYRRAASRASSTPGEPS